QSPRAPLPFRPQRPVDSGDRRFRRQGVAEGKQRLEYRSDSIQRPMTALRITRLALQGPEGIAHPYQRVVVLEILEAGPVMAQLRFHHRAGVVRRTTLERYPHGVEDGAEQRLPLAEQVVEAEHRAPQGAGFTLGIEDMAQPEQLCRQQRHAVARRERRSDFERMPEDQQRPDRDSEIGQYIEIAPQDAADAGTREDEARGPAGLLLDDRKHADAIA